MSDNKEEPPMLSLPSPNPQQASVMNKFHNLLQTGNLGVAGFALYYILTAVSYFKDFQQDVSDMKDSVLNIRNDVDELGEQFEDRTEADKAKFEVFDQKLKTLKAELSKHEVCLKTKTPYRCMED